MENTSFTFIEIFKCIISFVGECVEKFSRSNEYAPYSAHNNKADCQRYGGKWLEYTNYLEKAPQHTSKLECEAASKDGIYYKWARPMGSIEEECLVLLDAPECKQAPWSRDNHLGNGMNAQPLSYKWQIPYFPSGQEQRCVLRIRLIFTAFLCVMSNFYFLIFRKTGYS